MPHPSRSARRPVPLVVTVWDNIAGHFVDCPRRGPVRRRALAEASLFYVVSERSAAALALDGVAPERVVRASPSGPVLIKRGMTCM